MSTGTLRVLHAEPEAELASVVREAVERKRPDAAVDTVGSVEAALEALEGGTYDCVVSDGEMPDGDGVDLLAAVREREPDLPFLFFTAGEAVASEVISAGVTDHLRVDEPGAERALADRVVELVERARTDAALAESRRRLRTLVSNFPGLVYRASLSDPWEMEFVGGHAECITGYTAAALERGDVTFGEDLIHPDDREAVADTITAKILEQEPFEITYRIRTADGDTRHVREHGEPVTQGSNPVALEGFVIDITERVEREQRLREQNDRLDEFASTVSHDLRNPLNVAVGRLSMVEVDDPNVDTARDALERMDALIDDLLALARDGRAVDDPTPVDLAALARESWQGVETEGATLDVRTERTVPGAKPQLRRALENLMRNSVEHGSTSSRPKADDAVEHGSTGNQTPSDDAVEHGSESTAADGLTVSVGATEDGFYVADDGQGIPPEDREHVFDRGYSTGTESTGFGLTIVEHVVEAHGWEISAAESEEGGARFEVTGVD